MSGSSYWYFDLDVVSMVWCKARFNKDGKPPTVPFIAAIRFGGCRCSK